MNQEETITLLPPAVNKLHDLSLVRAILDGTDDSPIPAWRMDQKLQLIHDQTSTASKLEEEISHLDQAASGTGNNQVTGEASNQNSLDKQQRDVELLPDYEDDHIRKMLPATYRLVRNCICRRQYDKAQLLCEEKIKRMKKHSNNLLESIATEILAMVYCAEKKYAEAIEVLSKALEVRRSECENNELIIAITLNNLALFHAALGNYEDAQSLCRSALHIKQKLIKPKHPEMGRQLYNLGVVYQLQGDYNQAEEVYVKSLNIYKKSSVPKNPIMQQLRSNLEICQQMRIKMQGGEPLPLALQSEDDKSEDEAEQSPQGDDREKKVSDDQPPKLPARLHLTASGSGNFLDAGEASNQNLPNEQKSALLVTDTADKEQIIGCYPASFDPTNLYVNICPISIDKEVQYLLDEGMYEEAKTFCEETVSELRRSSEAGVDGLQVAGVLTTLASVYNAREEYSEVIVILSDILKIHERELGPNDLSVGVVLNNLAVYHGLVGSYQEAIVLGSRSLQIKIVNLGHADPQVARQFHNLGVFSQKNENYLIAEECYKKARAIFKQRLGSGSPAMVALTSNLTTCLIMQGKIEEADAFQRHLPKPKRDDKELQNLTRQLSLENGADGKIKDLQYGQTSTKVEDKEPYLNIAAGGSDSNQDFDETSNQDFLDKQQEVNNEQLAGCCGALIDYDDIHVGTSPITMQEEIQCLITKGMYEEAKTFCEDTVNELRRTSETKMDDLFIADVLYMLSSVYGVTKEYQKVIPLLSHIIKIRERELGNNHLSIATVLNNLALCHGIVGNHVDAEALCERSVRIKKEHLGLDDPIVGTQLYNLGVFRQKLHKYASAEECFKQARDIYKHRLDPESSYVVAATNNLVACLRVQGKSEEAEAIQDQN